MQTIAVTGGTGFVGTALLQLLSDRGVAARALARDPARLKSPSAAVVKGDLGDAGALRELVAGADAVIHLAGVTHPRDDRDFAQVNVEGAKAVAAAAKEAGARLVHTSSMSARQPEASAYAASKLASEAAVGNVDPSAVSLRLPAIYGPGDMATLPYFRLIKSGLAFEPATPTPARASLLYVDDAASALFTAATSALVGVYDVGDDSPTGRSWTEIGAVLAATLDRKARRIRAPRFAVAAIHTATRRFERVAGHAPSVRTGQVNEFFHPDWVAAAPLFADASGWRPATPLAEGFAKTARWYQEKGLL